MKARKSFPRKRANDAESEIKKMLKAGITGKCARFSRLGAEAQYDLKKLENTDKTHLAKRAPVNITRALEMKAPF